MLRSEDVTGERLSPDDADELLDSDDVTRLGALALERKRDVSGDSVYFGPATGLDEAELGPEPEGVDADALIGAPDDPLELHREAHDAGVPTDVAAEYGGADFVDELVHVRRLQDETGGVRCFTAVAPAGGKPTTAYTDLKSVAVARLFLDNVAHVRIARDAVGDKLAQTALEFGVDDVGSEDEGEYDTELLIEEAGFTPVRRDRGYHG